MRRQAVSRANAATAPVVSAVSSAHCVGGRGAMRDGTTAFAVELSTGTAYLALTVALHPNPVSKARIFWRAIDVMQDMHGTAAVWLTR
ncbi:hypothetical protein ACXPWS_10045 [Mycobacterium sp. BMJ-28]